MTVSSSPSQGVVDYYRHLFSARLDVYSQWVPDAGWRPVREELTVATVSAALSKQAPPLSGYMIAPGDVTHVAAIDFDLENGMELAVQLGRAMATEGAPCYIEGSRRGAHLWIPLAVVAPAIQVRAALMHWLEAARMPRDPENPSRFHPKIELRPGSDQLGGEGKLGHCLRLPLMPHPATGQRYRITTPDGEVLGPSLGAILLGMDPVSADVLADAAVRYRPMIRPSDVPAYLRQPKGPRDDDDASASEIMRTLWGALDAKPGKVIRCPAKEYHSHGDAKPGCRVFPDDKRVMCHKTGCVLNNDGKGLGTWQLAHFAPRAK